MKRRTVLLGAATAASGILPLRTFAQEPWPAAGKPVKIVVPYPPGGTVDFAARQFAGQLAKQMNGSFIVENRAGASGMIGTSYVAASPPDGHTLLAVDTSYAIRPGTIKSIPYDTASAFAHVSTLFQSPFVLIVAPGSPYTSAEQIFAAARKNPEKITFGSGGVGTSLHLAAELMMAEGKFKMFHVPFKGGAEAMVAVMGGQVDCFVTTMPSVMGALQGEKLRALAVSGARRVEALPDVPLFSEVGLPGFVARDWIGISAPRATPAPAISALNEQVTKAVADRAFTANLVRQGADPAAMPAKAFSDFVDQQLLSWAKVCAGAGITPA